MREISFFIKVQLKNNQQANKGVAAPEMTNREQNVQVSDTTKAYSSTTAGYIVKTTETFKCDLPRQ
jgi:hypothetical protein